MYVPFCPPTFSDVTLTLFLCTAQSTVIPLTVTHISLDPISVVKAEVALKDKDVCVFPTNILHTSFNSAFAFQLMMTQLPVPHSSAADRAATYSRPRTSLPTLTLVAMTLLTTRPIPPVPEGRTTVNRTSGARVNRPPVTGYPFKLVKRDLNPLVITEHPAVLFPILDLMMTMARSVEMEASVGSPPYLNVC